MFFYQSLFFLVSGQLSPRKTAPHPLGLRLGLELGLRLWLGAIFVGDNCHRTFFFTFKCHKSEWYLEALRLDLRWSAGINKIF